MDYYDYEQEQIRKRIKRRYDRRFAFIKHILALIVMTFTARVVSGLDVVALLLGIALIPHLFFLMFHEYQDWLKQRIEHEFDREQSSYTKRKRYPQNQAEQPSFRLTDDGEIEEIPIYQEDYQTPAYASKSSDDRHKRRYKKRRKDDSDEFDVKKLLKKLKDIVD